MISTQSFSESQELLEYLPMEFGQEPMAFQLKDQIVSI